MVEDGRSSSAEQIFPREKISTEVGLIINSASGTSLESFGSASTTFTPSERNDGPSTTSSTSRILQGSIDSN
ncbi:UNVERIFIED_CONTAM: hypothetical protein GTU68_034423 [Idotea baltica]|nr:hypothetical protein [Idotea baltica]